MNAYQRVSLFGQITLLLASTLTVMAGATIAPGLPAMKAAFAAEENADFLVRLVLTLPALFIVLGAPLAGFLIDRFGRKRLLLFSAILYAAAGSSGFFLNSLMLILIGRALLGFAVAGIMTSVTTLIADYFTGVARAPARSASQFYGFGRRAVFIVRRHPGGCELALPVFNLSFSFAASAVHRFHAV